MQGSTPLSLACSLLAVAAPPAIPVTTIAQLPAEVQAELASMGPVSDPGGAFSPSDVVDAEHPVPTQRLISGQAGPDCILLTIEKGGRGYSHGVLRFERKDGHWVLASLVYQQP